MNLRERRKPVSTPLHSSPVRLRTATVFACAALLAVSLASAAGTLYKWTDAQGQVHYADKPPKGFTGEVTRIDVDTSSQVVPPVAAPKVEVAPPAPAAVPAEPDLLTQRRATRARLEANLARARERLDLARKALAEASNASGEDFQYAQRRVDPTTINPNQAGGGVLVTTPSANPDATQSQAARGGMLGMAPRTNCRTAPGPGGKPVLICPTAVPNSDYYERTQKLEDEVKRAEEDVAQAEIAYRRGVD